MIFLPALLALLLPLALCAPPPDIELDSEDNDNLATFEKVFHLPEIIDPEEKAKREEALKANEEIIKEENKEFLEGKKTWNDAVNKFSDLTKDEFEAEKTGLVSGTVYARGLIMPTGPVVPDAESEAYFAALRSSVKMNRASVPSSYSAVDKGLVSPVKDQKQCGSCVAYATMSAVETCFKKKTGVFGDYSEQQMVDCGYAGKYGAGCNGAPLEAYSQWAKESKAALTSEVAYPYTNTNPTLTCPTDVKGYNQGAKVSGLYFTYKGDEETLKALVAKKGAVISGVAAAGALQSYSGGIFSGCNNTNVDHAITVVGYGTEKGVDYWLIKNSWGSDWGEGGFIRLQRGVGMCGIGGQLVTVKCKKVAGPTDATITTQAPCVDKYSNCADAATKWCYMADYQTGCCKSCGAGPGLTPAASTTCYDEWTNCPDLCKWYPGNCKKSCGGC